MSDVTVGIIIFPKAEELDWAGPYEVFGVAAMHEAMQVVTIAQTTEPVRCANGIGSPVASSMVFSQML